APVLFRAAVAFHQSGDRTREEQVWKRLDSPPGGILIGKQKVNVAQLRQEVDRLPGGRGNTRDWPVFRGDASRSVRSQGDVPYPEPRWQVSTLNHEDSKRWVELAVKCQEESLQPVLPTLFPITAADKLVCRTYNGIQAIDLKTGRKVWDTELPLSLEACLKAPGKKVQVRSWLPYYSPTGGMPSGYGAFTIQQLQLQAIQGIPVQPAPGFIGQQQGGFGLGGFQPGGFGIQGAPGLPPGVGGNLGNLGLGGPQAGMVPQGFIP